MALDPYRADAGFDFRCPRCRHEGVELRFIGHISVGRCERCFGIWVTRHALEAILRDDRLQSEVRVDLEEDPAVPTNMAVPRGAPMYVPCPECDELMARRRFANARVVVDVCRSHGAWFDRHELSASVGAASTRLASIDAVFWPAIETKPRPIHMPELSDEDHRRQWRRSPGFVRLLLAVGHWLRR